MEGNKEIQGNGKEWLIRIRFQYIGLRLEYNYGRRKKTIKCYERATCANSVFQNCYSKIAIDAAWIINLRRELWLFGYVWRPFYHWR